MASVGCNGSLELCDRRLDEVVFAGTHNSMAASARELARRPADRAGSGRSSTAGVRAFLIDLHYGGRSGDRIRTDVRSESDMEALDAVSPEAARG